MSTEDTILPVDASAAFPARLAFAAALAERHGAHLICMCVFEIRRIPGAGFGMVDSESSMALSAYQALFSSGRSILVVSYAGWFTEVGRRVLVGWNGRREAARAVHDAVLLISGADEVIVLAIDPQDGLIGRDGDPAPDIARHLARHGLRVTAAQTASAGLDAADVLPNHAADLGADLIVVGGYGHSRAWEMVLGGVTRALLQRMTVPVLMSHRHPAAISLAKAASERRCLARGASHLTNPSRRTAAG